MRVGVIQMNVGEDKQENLAKLELHISSLAKAGCDLAVAPEMSMFVGQSPSSMREAAEQLTDSAFASAISDLAVRNRMNIHLGSMMERRNTSYFNTSVLYGRDGVEIARYSKIHRFDIDLPNGPTFRESDFVDGGNTVVVANVDDMKLGFSICYDIRFPELYRELCDKGADMIVAPSAFAFVTGADHWEILLRARAIETQCYVIAPGQTGYSAGGKSHNFGHSLIIDPWGLVIAQVSNVEGVAFADILPDYIEAVRSHLPIRQHRVL